MSEPHPEPETLVLYVRGALGRDAARALERHLAGCLACQAAVEEIPGPAAAVVRWAGHRFAGRPDAPPDSEEEARRANLRQVLAALAGVIGTLGEGFAARLLAESEHGRRALIRGDSRFQSPAVCAALLARCREAWFSDPAGAVELGKLAVAVAGHLEADAPRADAWKALAWMHLGDAYRIASGGTPAVEVAEPPSPTAAEDAGSFVGEGRARSPEAETALHEVGEAFLERGLDVQAALVSLESAAVCLRQGRREEIPPLAERAAGRLEAAGASPALAGALRRMGEAAAGGELDQEWLESTAAELRRSRESFGRERT